MSFIYCSHHFPILKKRTITVVVRKTTDNIRKNVEAKILDWIPNKAMRVSLGTPSCQARADLAQLYTYGVVLRWVPELQYLLGFQARNVFPDLWRNILIPSYPGFELLRFFGGLCKLEHIDFQGILGFQFLGHPYMLGALCAMPMPEKSATACLKVHAFFSPNKGNV